MLPAGARSMGIELNNETSYTAPKKLSLELKTKAFTAVFVLFQSDKNTYMGVVRRSPQQLSLAFSAILIDMQRVIAQSPVGPFYSRKDL